MAIKPALFVPWPSAIVNPFETMHWILGLSRLGLPWIEVPYGPTDVVRNEAAKTLLESDCTHIVMLDIDHTHPLDIVHRLARNFASDKHLQVAGALMFSRKPPHMPCCGILQNGQWGQPTEWPEGLLEVDYVGTGAIMIRRDVFETLELPWFYYPYDHEQNAQGVWISEDIGFSRKCRAAGIRMFVDTTITSPHHVLGTISESTFRAYQRIRE